MLLLFCWICWPVCHFDTFWVITNYSLSFTEHRFYFRGSPLNGKNSLAVSVNHNINPSQESMKQHRNVDDEGAVDGFGRFLGHHCAFHHFLFFEDFFTFVVVSLNR